MRRLSLCKGDWMNGSPSEGFQPTSKAYFVSLFSNSRLFIPFFPIALRLRACSIHCTSESTSTHIRHGSKGNLRIIQARRMLKLFKRLANINSSVIMKIFNKSNRIVQHVRKKFFVHSPESRMRVSNVYRSFITRILFALAIRISLHIEWYWRV